MIGRPPVTCRRGCSPLRRIRGAGHLDRAAANPGAPAAARPRRRRTSLGRAGCGRSGTVEPRHRASRHPAVPPSRRRGGTESARHFRSTAAGGRLGAGQAPRAAPSDVSVTAGKKDAGTFHPPLWRDTTTGDRRLCDRSNHHGVPPGLGACAPAPSHAVDLAGLVADDVSHPAAVHPAGGRAAATGPAAAREAGVRVPGRQGDRQIHRRSAYRDFSLGRAAGRGVRLLPPGRRPRSWGPCR